MLEKQAKPLKSAACKQRPEGTRISGAEETHKIQVPGTEMHTLPAKSTDHWEQLTPLHIHWLHCISGLSFPIPFHNTTITTFPQTFSPMPRAPLHQHKWLCSPFSPPHQYWAFRCSSLFDRKTKPTTQIPLANTQILHNDNIQPATGSENLQKWCKSRNFYQLQLQVPLGYDGAVCNCRYHCWRPKRPALLCQNWSTCRPRCREFIIYDKMQQHGTRHTGSGGGQKRMCFSEFMGLIISIVSSIHTNGRGK